MDEIVKFVENNLHMVLSYSVDEYSIQIYTLCNELINIRPMKIKGKKGFYEVIVTVIENNTCDYTAYTLDIIDVFKLLNEYLNNFYRDYYLEEEFDEL